MKKVDTNLLDVMRIMEKKYSKSEIEHLFKTFPDNDSYSGFEEPLPDFIGYKQHSAECASDAIQEILLFADDLREYTQPILYNLTSDQINIRSKLMLKYIDWDRYSDYFRYIQKRFRAHYDVINYMRTHKIKPQAYVSNFNEMCTLNPLFQKKRLESAKGGILALKKLHGEKTYSETGMSRSQISKTIQNILQWLNVPFKIIVDRSSIILEKTKGIHLSFRTGYVKSDGDIYWRSTGHSTAFIKMNNKWYYYDNEDGFHDVSEELITSFMDPSQKVNIYILKKQYFVKGGVNPTHVWKKDHWSTDLHEIAKHVADGKYVAKTNTIVMDPYHSEMYGIQKEDVKFIQKQCEFKAPTSSEDAIKTVHKLIECIYTHPDSNSGIFEDLYHYMYDNLEYLKTDHELFANLVSTLPTVVKRPACTPMIHYWVYAIQSAIKHHVKDTYAWFEMPILKEIVLPPGVPTPLELRERIRKAIEEKQKIEALHEKGIDAEKVVPDVVAKKKTRKLPSKNKKSPCPSAQVRDRKTGECVPKPTKLSPCPPGHVRNSKTKKCKPRLVKQTPCPPGQIRDKKTRKCRPLEKYKLHD